MIRIPGALTQKVSGSYIYMYLSVYVILNMTLTMYICSLWLQVTANGPEVGFVGGTASMFWVVFFSYYNKDTLLFIMCSIYGNDWTSAQTA